MGEEQSKRASDRDAALEREIRQGREFSLADAIGRLAGPGAMKGVSPVTRKQQAEAAIQDYLSRNLPDPSGSLRVALLRQVAGSDFLLKTYEQPLAALADHLRRILGSEHVLTELVREADVEWGRMYGERPCFEGAGRLTDPNDPYTIESVRNTLAELVRTLAASPTQPRG